MRAYLRSTFLDVVGAFRVPKKGVHILNGHFLDRDDHLDAKRFENLLRGLRNYSEFLDVEEAVRLVGSGSCQDFDGVGIAFTFDDGFLDCYTGIAPALKKFDVNACFFVNPGFVDGTGAYRENFTHNVVMAPNKSSLNWEQIRHLHEEGFVIGNHTIDHFRLNSENQAEIYRQIVGGREIIEEKIAARVEYFAWPYGQASDIGEYALDVACKSHKFVFSGFGSRNYFSFGGRVLNRRHFEADWNLRHLRYFLSFERKLQKLDASLRP